jgi:hypothetical protein
MCMCVYVCTSCMHRHVSSSYILKTSNCTKTSLYACMPACRYVCITCSVYMCMYVFGNHVCAYAHTRKNACMHACLHAGTCMNVCMCISCWDCGQVCAYACTRKNAKEKTRCVPTYVYVCIYVCMHTYMHVCDVLICDVCVCVCVQKGILPPKKTYSVCSNRWTKNATENSPHMTQRICVRLPRQV